MRNIFHWMLFKLISFVFQMIMSVQSLVNDFIRHVYIPLIISSNNPQKIIDDISTFAKKPHDQVTIMVDVKINKPSDITRTALKIARYSKIIEESIFPNNFNCFLSIKDLNESEREELLKNLTDFQPKESKLKVILEEQVDYMQKLKIEKSKITPLIISFCSYPSIGNLPPYLLIGAEISFNPQILKTVDYDIYTAFQKYSTSEQRKGK